MILCSMIVTFEFQDVSSLKGRRAILNSLKDRLKSLNVSVLDISGDYPKEATLAIAFLSPDSAMAARYRERIETLIESRFPEYPFETDYDEF